MRTLLWFRGKDLRVRDHGPLREAARAGEVVPLFVLDPYFFAPGRASGLAPRMQVLLESLSELSASLESLGSRLVIVDGRSVDRVPEVAARLRVDRVVAHRWSEPFGRERDRRVAAALRVPLELHEGETLAPPGSLLTAAGTPYAVFTPFARAFAGSASVAEPLSAPRRLPPVPPLEGIPALAVPTLAALGLRARSGLPTGGERAGRERLRRFLRGPGGAYDTLRDRPGAAATSRLSVDLHFGTVSVRAAYRAGAAGLSAHPAAQAAFLRQLLWREFALHLLHAHPELLERPFRRDWEGFPFREDDAGYEAWAQGRTGYPIVDAAARQLLAEGYVENRARMVAASFLVKDLLVDFRRGEAHYMANLVDGDWASNDLGWQWVTGCGCDAQPWFRVFHPVLQGERFDPEGEYVRRHVPELARVPARYVHRPWEAPAAVLREAGVELGRDYPRPIVDHREAAARFLRVARGHLGRGRP